MLRLCGGPRQAHRWRWYTFRESARKVSGQRERYGESKSNHCSHSSAHKTRTDWPGVWNDAARGCCSPHSQHTYIHRAFANNSVCLCECVGGNLGECEIRLQPPVNEQTETHTRAHAMWYVNIPEVDAKQLLALQTGRARPLGSPATQHKQCRS